MSVLNETLKDLRNRGQESNGGAVMGDFGPMVSVPIEEPKRSYGVVLLFLLLLFLVVGGGIAWWVLQGQQRVELAPLAEAKTQESQNNELPAIDQQANAESVVAESERVPVSEAEITESRVPETGADNVAAVETKTIVAKPADAQIQTIAIKTRAQDTAHYVIGEPDPTPASGEVADEEPSTSTVEQGKEDPVQLSAADEAGHSHKSAPESVTKPVHKVPASEAQPKQSASKERPAKPARQVEAPPSVIAESPRPEVLAQQAFARGEFSLARSAWLQALAEQPSSLAAYEGLALVDLSSGDYASLPAIYRAASANGVQSEVLSAALVRANLATTNLSAALSNVDRALTAYPNSAQLTELKANTLQRLGRWNDAAASYTHLLAKHGKKAEWWLGLGYCYEQVGQRQQAYSAYRRAQLSESELSPGLQAFVTARIADIAGDPQ